MHVKNNLGDIHVGSGLASVLFVSTLDSKLQLGIAPGQGLFMKKAIIALFATIGLVLSAASFVSPAQAAPYPGTVKTLTRISAPSSVNEGKSFTVKATVKGGSSSAVAGKIRISFRGKTVTKTVWRGTTSVKFKAPKVSKTKSYTISVKYTPKSGSVYKASSASKKIKVKNKKKKK